MFIAIPFLPFLFLLFFPFLPFRKRIPWSAHTPEQAATDAELTKGGTEPSQAPKRSLPRAHVLSQIDPVSHDSGSHMSTHRDAHVMINVNRHELPRE